MDPARSEKSFDVLIVGGGNAGLSTAGRLLRRGVSSVAVIEPQDVHTYRPLLSYVGGGQASQSSAERTQRSVTPKGCTWLRHTVYAVDAEVRTVHCGSGASFRYEDLVLCPGLAPDDDALPGIAAALSSPGVASNYLDHAEKTWQLVQSMPEGGRAVFTVPRPPVSCTGTTLKPLFLAAAHWKRTGRLPGVEITLLVNRPNLLGVPELDDRLRRCLDELGVRVLFDASVTALTPFANEISVTLGDNTSQTVGYDMLHLVPPFRGPQWLSASGLADDAAHGLVDVDPRTLRHRTHPTVWALGDAANVATDPSGGGLRRQTSILVNNVLAARRGEGLAEYDGYTVAPVATDAHRLIFGEFDRSQSVASSLPSFLDPVKPYRWAWAFDRYGLPQMYWNLILKGRA